MNRQLTDGIDAHGLPRSGGIAELDRFREDERGGRELDSVSSALWTLSSRRLSLVVIADMSASIVTSVTVVPSMTNVPLTSGVRPTAVVDPMPVSSSSTRNPTKVPVESS